MGKSRHYEVVWRMHTRNGIIPKKADRKFYKMRSAQEELDRQLSKNEHFIEVDGFTPFISDAHIVQVDTEVTRRTVS